MAAESHTFGSRSFQKDRLLSPVSYDRINQVVPNIQELGGYATHPQIVLGTCKSTRSSGCRCRSMTEGCGEMFITRTSTRVQPTYTTVSLVFLSPKSSTTAKLWIHISVMPPYERTKSPSIFHRAGIMTAQPALPDSQTTVRSGYRQE